MNGFPFTNLHDINLDWILAKLKKAVFSINGQGPDENGNINLGGVAANRAIQGRNAKYGSTTFTQWELYWR